VEELPIGRAWRNNDREAEALASGVAEDIPSLNAPIEERQRWLLEHRGPEYLAPEVLEDLRDRVCAMPECDTKAVSRSLFCGYHQRTAVGEAGARELRQLTREMERLGRITNGEAKKREVGKFRKRVESGDFAILFSGKMQETLDRAAKDAELTMELGALRVALVRALQEIEDPAELSTMISRIANASARTVRANAAVRKERGRSGSGTNSGSPLNGRGV
jgi:hypothetical protein